MAKGLRATLELPAAAVTINAAPPEMVSQRTAERHLGIPRRAYLQSLASYRAAGGEVVALGRLRLVRPTDYLEHLRGRELAKGADVTGAMAEELGLRIVEGGAR